MPAYNRTIPAAAPEALASAVFDDALELHAGGETVGVAAKPAAAGRAGMEGDGDRFVTAVYEGVKG